MKLKELTRKWVLAMPNDKKSLVINKYNGICMNHFISAEIQVFIGPKQTRRKLKPDSIPSVFKSNDDIENRSKIPRISQP